jgi:putative transposase
VTGFRRSSHRYRSRRNPQVELRLRLRDRAAARVRYGYRRLHVLLRREGWPMNHKRTYRLYSEEGLSMRTKVPRRKRAWRYRVGRPRATAPNEVRSMDFVSDALFDGRPIRILTVIDAHTREALSIVPRANFRAFDVWPNSTGWRASGGRPRTLKVDNGPEFAGRSWTRDLAERGGDRLLPPRQARRTTPTSRRSTAASGRSASTLPGSCHWRTRATGWRLGGGSTTRNGRTGHWET